MIRLKCLNIFLVNVLKRYESQEKHRKIPSSNTLEVVYKGHSFVLHFGIGKNGAQQICAHTYREMLKNL